MPHFQVLRCYVETCGIFQSQQVKKAPKWQCKVCGEKQSVKRIYFDSENAKDCRQAVQQLNLKRKDIDEKRGFPGFHSLANNYDVPEFPPVTTEAITETVQAQLENSKWNSYASEESEPEINDEPGITTDMSVIENPKQARKSRKKRSRDTQPSDLDSSKTRLRKQPTLVTQLNKKGSVFKEQPNTGGNAKTGDLDVRNLSKKSRWSTYEEDEDHSQEEECQHSSFSNIPPKSNNTTTKSSKWSTYMEAEEEEEEEEENPFNVRSYTSQVQPLLSSSIINEPPVDNDNPLVSSSEIIQTTSPDFHSASVDTQLCTISSKTRTRLSQFTFPKSRSSIKSIDHTSANSRHNSSGQTINTAANNAQTTVEENDIDVLEIDEIDPFTV